MKTLLQGLALLKAPIVLAAMALLFWAERRWPADAAARRAGPAGRGRLWRHFALWGLNIGLYAVLVLPVTSWAALHAPTWRPDWPGGAWRVALDLLLLDLWLYGWHRANHEWPLLWRFHEIHHLDETLDSTSALRFHFGEVALSALARAVLIWLLGIGLGTVLLFETLVLAATLFHHSNLRLPPWLEAGLARIIITPSRHWVHHHAHRPDTDSTYGTILALWDLLFRSRTATARRPGMKIGVEGGPGDRPLKQLLTRPFR